METLPQAWRQKTQQNPNYEYHHAQHHEPPGYRRTATQKLLPTRITNPPPPLPEFTIPEPCSDLEKPFTIAELNAAIRQGRPKSAPGHDGIQ